MVGVHQGPIERSGSLLMVNISIIQLAREFELVTITSINLQTLHAHFLNNFSLINLDFIIISIIDYTAKIKFYFILYKQHLFYNMYTRTVCSGYTPIVTKDFMCCSGKSNQSVFIKFCHKYYKLSLQVIHSQSGIVICCFS